MKLSHRLLATNSNATPLARGCWALLCLFLATHTFSLGLCQEIKLISVATKPILGDSQSSITAATTLELSPTAASVPADTPVQVPQFGSIGAREIGCRAAQRWMPAIGLKQRALTIQQLYRDQDSQQVYAAKGIAQFLCLQAHHQEDLSAASAMRSYYSRIGIHEQLNHLDDALKFLFMQRSKQDKLMEQGMKSVVDLSSLDRQQLDIDDRRLQAVAQDDQLRRLLAGLTGMDYQTNQVLLEPLTVQPTEIDVDGMIQLALQCRYDLQSWRRLYGYINDDTAPVLASIIATSVGSYGIPVPKIHGIRQLICNSVDKSKLAQNLRQEVATIIATNESYVRQLVIEKCSQLQLAYQRLELHQKQIASWTYRLEQLDRLETYGDTRPAERATAETEIRKSRSDETTRRLDAKLAEVSLAEVVGGLADNCCCGRAWLPCSN